MGWFIGKEQLNNWIFLHLQKLSVLYWSLFIFMEVTVVGWLNNGFQQCLFSEVKLYETISNAQPSQLAVSWTGSLCSVLLKAGEHDLVEDFSWSSNTFVNLSYLLTSKIGVARMKTTMKINSLCWNSLLHPQKRAWSDFQPLWYRSFGAPEYR